MSGSPLQVSSDETALRLHQQELVARFGLFALSPGMFQRLIDEACRIAAEGLGTTLAKVLRYRHEADDFLVTAGVGWHPGVVGHATLGSGLDSPAGFAMHTGEPTLSNHLVQDSRFKMPELLAEHGVQSAINVIIGQADQKPFGVIEVDSTRRNDFVHADIAFLQSLANVLAAGLARVEYESAQEVMLRDKDLLMLEVHHRVKNSLQLVRTMLTLQSRGASDETRTQLDKAAGRIMSIAAVHHRLYDGGSVNEGDAGLYLRGLVDDMQALLDDASQVRSIALQVEPMMLPADTLTPLGLIVTELVTNAIKYGDGAVTVQVSRVEQSLQVICEDGGAGFATGFRARSGLGMRLITALAKGNPAEAFRVDRSVPHGRVIVTITL